MIYTKTLQYANFTLKWDIYKARKTFLTKRGSTVKIAMNTVGVTIELTV